MGQNDPEPRPSKNKSLNYTSIPIIWKEMQKVEVLIVLSFQICKALKKNTATQTSVLSRILQALFKCQSEIGWRENGNVRLEKKFSTDVTHLRSEFKIFIQIIILTGSRLYPPPHFQLMLCTSVCEFWNFSALVSHWIVKVVGVSRDINGLGLLLYSIIADRVLIWPAGCFHLQVSVLPRHRVLTSPSLLISEYKWVLSSYLSK